MPLLCLHMAVWCTPQCLCRGSTCGLRMLILPGSCVGGGGGRLSVKGQLWGRRALLAEARAPPTRTPLVLAPSLRGEVVQESTQVLRNWRF